MTELIKSCYENYFENSIQGNREACYAILLSELEKGTEIETIYIDFIQKSLYQIGELWELNKISVAVEHMVTANTEVILAQLFPKVISGEKNGNKVVVACSPFEMHQIGSRIVADYLELKGWDSIFLGANATANSLISMVEETEPELVGLSVSIYFNLRHLYKSIEELNKRFASTNIIVGGQAFRWSVEDIESKFDNVRLLKSIPELEKYIMDPKWN